jgi:hypothetical protein
LTNFTYIENLKLRKKIWKELYKMKRNDYHQDQKTHLRRIKEKMKLHKDVVDKEK